VSLRLSESIFAVPNRVLKLRKERSRAIAACGDLPTLVGGCNGLGKIPFMAVQSGPRNLEPPCRRSDPVSQNRDVDRISLWMPTDRAALRHGHNPHLTFFLQH
jgi:hypothetical protein